MKKREWITFIQWKGTDVCMDWYCVKCGNQEHEDRDFCYEVTCTKCGAVYTVGDEVTLTLKVDELPAKVEVIEKGR